MYKPTTFTEMWARMPEAERRRVDELTEKLEAEIKFWDSLPEPVLLPLLGNVVAYSHPDRGVWAMKYRKPALSRYEQHLADMRRFAKIAGDWELQPNMFGNELDAGNGDGLAFDWSLDAFGRHIAAPTGGGAYGIHRKPAKPEDSLVGQHPKFFRGVSAYRYGAKPNDTGCQAVGGGQL